MLTDTHIHLYADQFESDREQLVQEALSVGVDRFFLPNIDLESIGPMLELEEKYPGKCFPMMGLHPCYVKDGWEKHLDVIESWWQRRTFCAVGEIGIDLYWDKNHLAEQQAAFRRQIRLANTHKRPVVIHCRESFKEIIEVLDDCRKETPQGIFHCFTGTVDQAQAVIDRGFLLGIGGVVTFKKSGLDAVVKEIPLEHLVLETDGPYLAPTPHRGKRNIPSYLRLVAEQVEAIKGIPLQEVAAITTENSRRLFGC
ncbi:MAG: TatD family hydrolase [Bacteroidota bacterium]